MALVVTVECDPVAFNTIEPGQHWIIGPMDLVLSFVGPSILEHNLGAPSLPRSPLPKYLWTSFSDYYVLAEECTGTKISCLHYDETETRAGSKATSSCLPDGIKRHIVKKNEIFNSCTTGIYYCKEVDNRMRWRISSNWSGNILNDIKIVRKLRKEHHARSDCAEISRVRDRVSRLLREGRCFQNDPKGWISRAFLGGSEIICHL